MFPGTALYHDKGNDFFARSEWTETAINKYYSTQNLSGIPVETRRSWMTGHFAAYARWHWWMDALPRYPLRSLAALIFLKLRGRIKRKMLRILQKYM